MLLAESAKRKKEDEENQAEKRQLEQQQQQQESKDDNEIRNGTNQKNPEDLSITNKVESLDSVEEVRKIVEESAILKLRRRRKTITDYRNVSLRLPLSISCFKVKCFLFFASSSFVSSFPLFSSNSRFTPNKF